MAEDPAHQPHDKLFKLGFGEPSRAAAFLRGQLPPELAAAIAWDRLAPEPADFVDSRFRQSESDLLFSAPAIAGSGAGAGVLVYLLFEHQREEDPLIALRLLRYMVRIWERRAEAGQPLVPVLPVVLAQNRRQWKILPRFAALLDIPQGAQPYVPDFRFALVQLAEMPLREIGGPPEVVLLLRALKAERIGALLDDALWDEELLRSAARVFELVLRYILASDVDSPAFHRKVKAIRDPALRTDTMTLAQQLRAEGKAEGKAEGLLAARQTDVLEALEVRFGGVPEGLAEAVHAVRDDGKLRELLRHAIRCADLEAFSEKL